MLPAIGAALVSAAGGLAENIFGGFRQDKTNEFNAQQAAINRDFQERMANTAYQRGMDDMKKAGLNPILAYQKGPASSPSGSTASGVNVGITPFISNAVDQYQKARSVSAQVDNMIEQNKNLSEQNKNLQETNGLIRAQTLQSSAAAAKTAAETAVVKQALEVSAGNAERGKTLDWWRGTLPGKGSAIVGDIIKDLSPWASSARDMSNIYDAVRGPRTMQENVTYTRDRDGGSSSRIRVYRRNPGRSE